MVEHNILLHVVASSILTNYDFYVIVSWQEEDQRDVRKQECREQEISWDSSIKMAPVWWSTLMPSKDRRTRPPPWKYL